MASSSSSPSTTTPLLLSPPRSATPKPHVHLQFPPRPHLYSPPTFPSKPTSPSKTPFLLPTKLSVSSQTNNSTTATSKPSPPAAAGGGAGEERVFFDGGAHYGDLLANLLLGFTLLWLPLTIAAVSRAFFLRYRFTNLRVTVVSGFTGQDRSDFSYKAIKDVQVVPRFIGEWGDIVITLRDGTKVDLRSVPRFREIADYCLYMANEGTKVSPGEKKDGSRARGF